MIFLYILIFQYFWLLGITPVTAAFWCDVLEGLTDFSFNFDMVFMILNNMNSWLISSFETQPLNENNLNKYLKLFMLVSFNYLNFDNKL